MDGVFPNFKIRNEVMLKKFINNSKLLLLSCNRDARSNEGINLKNKSRPVNIAFD